MSRRFYRRKQDPDVSFVKQPNGCWLWTRGKTTAGYGSFRLEGVDVYAHRYFYEKFVEPIPAGYVLDHLCRNRACVNPQHLEPVLQRVNARRGAKTRILAQQVVEIRNRYANSETAEAIASDFGISSTHVVSLCRGKRASDLGGPIQSGKRNIAPKKNVKVQRSDFAEIKALRKSGATLPEICRKYGISMGYACQIAKGTLKYA